MTAPRRTAMKRLVLFAAVALATAWFAGCWADRGHTSPGPGTGGKPEWERLPDLPLSKRFGPVVANVEGRIVVVGGDTGPQCPSNASCIAAPAAARDGAVLDPATKRWHRIASAPVDLSAFVDHAVVGDHLFVLQGRRLIDYDARAGRWRQLSTVSPWYDLVPDGDRLALVLGSDEDPSTKDAKDLVYDIARDRWSALPPDPLGPMFNRTLTATSRGLVLSGQPLSRSPEPTDPLHAALYDEKAGAWKKLPDGTQEDRIDPDTGTWRHVEDVRLPRKDEWAVEQDQDRSLTENLLRPAGAPERIGPVAWIGGTVYVVGGAGDHHGTLDEYDVRVWRITPHPAWQ